MLPTEEIESNAALEAAEAIAAHVEAAEDTEGWATEFERLAVRYETFRLAEDDVSLPPWRAFVEGGKTVIYSPPLTYGGVAVRLAVPAVKPFRDGMHVDVRVVPVDEEGNPRPGGGRSVCMTQPAITQSGDVTVSGVFSVWDAVARLGVKTAERYGVIRGTWARNVFMGQSCNGRGADVAVIPEDRVPFTERTVVALEEGESVYYVVEGGGVFLVRRCFTRYVSDMRYVVLTPTDFKAVDVKGPYPDIDEFDAAIDEIMASVRDVVGVTGFLVERPPRDRTINAAVRFAAYGDYSTPKRPFYRERNDRRARANTERAERDPGRCYAENGPPTPLPVTVDDMRTRVGRTLDYAGYGKALFPENGDPESPFSGLPEYSLVNVAAQKTSYTYRSGGYQFYVDRTSYVAVLKTEGDLVKREWTTTPDGKSECVSRVIERRERYDVIRYDV